MRTILRVDPGDAAPIWRQIEEGVRRLVASRALAPGTALPSVRDLAKDLQVNPATVSKAYQRLVDAGVLVIRRGEGTYVSDTAPALRGGERKRILEEAALRLASVALTAGAAQRDAQDALAQAWAQLTQGTGADR